MELDLRFKFSMVERGVPVRVVKPVTQLIKLKLYLM
jgi:hypothetical protein